MRVLFAGTPPFAVPALVAIQDKYNVVGVYTQPDRESGRGKKVTLSAVKQEAIKLNLPILQPQSLRDQVEVIKQLKPDVFVVVAFGMLLPQSILDIPPLGCVNIHGSILPRWRGAAPIQRAIEAGDKETGVSIMKMEAGLDTGPIYQILKTTIDDHDTSQTLHDKLAILGAQGISDTLCELEDSLNHRAEISLEPQNDQLSTYAKKINKLEAQIDWRQSADKIQRKIQAFNPWPVCQTTHNSTRIRIWQSSVVSNPSQNINSIAGEVVQINENGITVACGTKHDSHASSVRLETLQRDGSRALQSKEFINGYSIELGDILK